MTVDQQRPEDETEGETLRIDSEAPPPPDSALSSGDPSQGQVAGSHADEPPAGEPEGPGSFGFEEDRPAFPADEDPLPVAQDASAFPVEEVPDAYAQRPELYAGGAFVGGFLLAKLIGRFGRG